MPGNSNIPLVSIVIPASNCERTIAETIDSIIKQTYKNIEILVIINNCNDSTEDVVRGLIDCGNISIYYANSGPAEARNLGAEIAKGDYLKFLDADDLLGPENVEHSVLFLETNEKMILVIGEGDLLELGVRSEDKSLLFSINLIKSSERVDESLFLDSNPVPQIHAALLRKTLYKKIKFDLNISNFEDHSYWIKCIRKVDKIGVLDRNDTLVRTVYRIQSGTRSDPNNINSYLQGMYDFRKLNGMKFYRKTLFYGFLLRYIRGLNFDGLVKFLNFFGPLETMRIVFSELCRHALLKMGVEKK